MNERTRKLVPQVAAIAVGVALILLFRGVFSGDDSPDVPGGGAAPNPDECVHVAVTASSEKAALVTRIAADFARSGAQVDGRCVVADVTSKSSGATMDALSRGWDEAIDGPRPDVWTPAGSPWVVLLEQRTAARDQPNLVPEDVSNIAYSPMVIAMPRPMAEALGWPDADVGWSDLFDLAKDPDGWGAYGHPEWGEFRLGKTNPNFSTSGLNSLIGTYFAATGLSSDLTLADVEKPKVKEFVRGVESAVVHYGDISLTFLSNLQKADDKGEGLSYVSAVAIEEKSVWDYNQGNPEGDPETLGDHPKPTVPLAAVYPEEGTLISDHPWVTLTAPWVDESKQAASDEFLAFLQAPEQQARFQEYAFRDYEGTPGPLTTQANGLLPKQPAQVLSPPSPQVLDRIQRSWSDLRKRARVLLVLDVSGSMGDPVPGSGASKLELAKEAAIDSLKLFAPDDDVGLWIFATGLEPGSVDTRELIPIGPVGPRVQEFQDVIRGLTAEGGTPLYTAVGDSVATMRAAYDADRINGVVLLSDGRNEDPNNSDLDGLLRDLESSEFPVRVFAVAYGEDSDLEVLTQIAEATDAAVYDASDATTISDVFVSVISNF